MAQASEGGEEPVRRDAAAQRCCVRVCSPVQLPLRSRVLEHQLWEHAHSQDDGCVFFNLDDEQALRQSVGQKVVATYLLRLQLRLCQREGIRCD